MPKNANPIAISRQVRLSRDDILAGVDPRYARWSVVLDGTAANLELLCFSRATGTGFAVSRHSGMLYLVVQTGDAKLSDWRVRVAVFAAHDDGTDKLSFATERFGGVVNQGVTV